MMNWARNSPTKYENSVDCFGKNFNRILKSLPPHGLNPHNVGILKVSMPGFFK